MCLLLSVGVAISLSLSPSASTLIDEQINEGSLTSAAQLEVIRSFLPEADGTVLSEYDNYMNTVGFENADGTKTVYMFGTDIKYQNESGSIQYYDSETINASLNTLDTNTNVGTSYITDATVYSNEASITHPDGNLCVGYDDTLGVARTYVRFNLAPIQSTVTSHNILSAYYHTRDVTPNPDGSSTPPVNSNTVADAYFVSRIWAESTITWNNKPGYYSTEKICEVNIYNKKLFSSDNITYAHDFYITSAVTAWLQGAGNYGIMIMAKDDSTWKQLASSENTTYPPYLCVTYYDDSATDLGKAVGITSSEKYVIANKNSELYLAAHSLISGDYVYQMNGSGAALQCWKPVYLGSGYYALKINDTNVCLEVPNDSTASGTGLTMATYTGATRQKWKIIRNWDGSYRIISALSSYCVSVADTSSTTETRIVQKSHTTNFSKEDDWTFMPAQKGAASLFCFSAEATGDIDTTAYMPQARNILNGAGYSSTLYTDASATTGFQKLQTSSIFLFSGHGHESLISFYDAGGNASYISASDYYYTSNSGASVYLPTSKIDTLSSSAFNNLLICLFSSCLTGSNKETTNLVGLMYQMGAHNLISHIDTTQNGPDADWVSRFVLNLSVGRNLGEAKNRADQTLYEEYTEYFGNLNERHDLGDQSLYLDYAAYGATTSSTSAQTVLPAASVETKRTFNILSATQDSQTMVINGSEQTLTHFSTLSEDSFGIAYDVYLDDYRNMYTFYQGSNTLASYEPNTALWEVGETVVPTDAALSLAENFLNDFGYDTTGFVCTHSNDYATDFRVEYRYYVNGEPTSEKLVFYIQADSTGTPYVTSFMARDYGIFSTGAQNTGIAAFSAQSEQSCATTSVSDATVHEAVNTAYWAVDSAGTLCWRSLVTTYNESGSSIEVIDRY